MFIKNISKILFLLTLSLVTLSLVTFAKAAITNSSRVIPYQGRLTDSSGNNVADGTYAMTFKIYTVSTGGSASFTETNSSVSVSSGLFSVLLGSLSANGVNLDFANPPYYLGITVGANAEMSPRIQLGFAPLAHNSQYLDGTPLSSFQLNTGVLTGAAGTNTRLQATGTGTGSTGNGSIYFLNSSGTTMGRFDTTDITKPLPGGYTSFWHLDESSGSSVADTSGSNTGTATGTTVVSGKLGNSRSFSSTSDKVQIGSPIVTGTGDFSISAWINPSSAGMGTNRYIAGNYGNSNTTGVELYLTTANIMRVYIGSAVSSVGTFSADTWYHVAVTRSGGNIKLYINGVQDGSGSLSGSLGSGANFTIGNGPDYTSERFQGLIDEVGVWTSAISSGEIVDYYNSFSNNYGTLHLGSTNSSSADLAEYYVTGDKSLESGDVVAIAPDNNSKGVLLKSNKPYDSKLVGVISTNPGVVLGSIDGDTGKSDKRQLALAGRVPVKIDPDSEPISVGDFLTSSSKPGFAKKATESGYVIGKALKSWIPCTTPLSPPKLGGETRRGGEVLGCGQDKIEVFINLIYKQEKSELDELRNENKLLKKRMDALEKKFSPLQ